MGEDVIYDVPRCFCNGRHMFDAVGMSKVLGLGEKKSRGEGIHEEKAFFRTNEEVGKAKDGIPEIPQVITVLAETRETFWFRGSEATCCVPFPFSLAELMSWIPGPCTYTTFSTAR